MRKWVWLLPCWIWKWMFHDLAKMNYYTKDGTYDCIRIDDEFVLVRHPVNRKPKDK
jgi:hypothetical protein